MAPEDFARISPELQLLTHKHPSIDLRADGRQVVAWETYILNAVGEFDHSEVRSRIITGVGTGTSIPSRTPRTAAPTTTTPRGPTPTGTELPNACDADADRDGIANDVDNCPVDANPNQEDAELDGVGNACDLCRDAFDPEQLDFDRDGLATACDSCPEDPDNDGDGDGRCNPLDNCPLVSNPNQEDGDSDSVGDPCDNCPTRGNYNQADSDGDGIGDACETFLRGDANSDATLDVSDVVSTLSYLFQGGRLRCSDAMDANDNGSVDVADPVGVLLHLFAGFPAPPPPWPVPGPDPPRIRSGARTSICRSSGGDSKPSTFGCGRRMRVHAPLLPAAAVGGGRDAASEQCSRTSGCGLAPVKDASRSAPASPAGEWSSPSFAAGSTSRSWRSSDKERPPSPSPRPRPALPWAAHAE